MSLLQKNLYIIVWNGSCVYLNVWKEEPPLKYSNERSNQSVHNRESSRLSFNPKMKGHNFPIYLCTSYCKDLLWCLTFTSLTSLVLKILVFSNSCDSLQSLKIHRRVKLLSLRIVGCCNNGLNVSNSSCKTQSVKRNEQRQKKWTEAITNQKAIIHQENEFTVVWMDDFTCIWGSSWHGMSWETGALLREISEFTIMLTVGVHLLMLVLLVKQNINVLSSIVQMSQ